MESASGSRSETPGRADDRVPPGTVVGQDPTRVLGTLVARLDLACEELFAVAPYAGDQSTGYAIDGCVDEIVGALRGLRADADDLLRVIEVSRLRGGGGR